MRGSIESGLYRSSGKRAGAILSIEDVEKHSVITINNVAIILLMLYFIVGIAFYSLSQGFTVLDSVCK
jgi:hypothetical protein